MITIELERDGDAAAIERILDDAFGPERRRKTAQRLRDGQTPVPALALVARERGGVIGTLRFWSVRIGRRHRALLLGPVAVDAAHRKQGVGAWLINTGLARAAALGHRAIILVGDAPYYGRFGFTTALTDGMTLPGPVDRARFLGLELETGALAGATGRVAADPDARALAPQQRRAAKKVRAA
jgi:predicted N-acetyltransferase YhbS